jgi:hypothetical protein
MFLIDLLIKSPRSYHAAHDYDDRVTLAYSVLPKRT